MLNLMGRMLIRQIPPDMAQLLLPPLLLRAMARGAVKEVGKKIWERLPLSNWG